MLVLSRKPQESIWIGDNIEIVVSSIQGNRVRLGIRAPKSVPIVRDEVAAEKTTRKTDVLSLELEVDDSCSVSSSV